MAGIKAPIFTKSFMVKIKYLNKSRMLATNPKNYYELVTSIYKCFPDIYNIDDCWLYFNDYEADRSSIKEDEDLQAAYKLMNLKKGNILTIYVDNKRNRKVVDGNIDSSSVQKIRERLARKNWSSMENSLLVRNGFVYEFSKATKNAYCYRCDDWKRGCKGKWYLYEKDTGGLGIEHTAHSLLKEEHKSMEISREVAKTALNIVPFLDMSGDLPYVVDYKVFKKVISRLLEKDFRMTKDDLINCFVSLGTDWNLLSKRLLDGIIGTIRSRLSVRMQGAGDCD
jgi:hypothetical protein